MQIHLRKLTVPRSDPMHLFHFSNQIWNCFPDSYFSNLVASMPNRVRSVRVGEGDRRNTGSFNLIEF